MTFKELGIKYDMPRGWKGKELWRIRAYYMWRNMWDRCRNPSAIGYKNYKDCKIDENFRLFSNYLKWLENEPRFKEFCSTCHEVRWVTDKDMKLEGNRSYYPEYMTLTTQSENAKEVENRYHFFENGRGQTRPVLAIQNSTILLFKSIKDATLSLNRSTSGSIRRALKNSHWTAHGFHWYYVNYKHGRKYKIGRD